jgi:hypothetical protein
MSLVEMKTAALQLPLTERGELAKALLLSLEQPLEAELERALEAAQYAHLDEATRNAILNAPITTWEETDPDAPEFDIPKNSKCPHKQF